MFVNEVSADQTVSYEQKLQFIKFFYLILGHGFVNISDINKIIQNTIYPTLQSSICHIITLELFHNMYYYFRTILSLLIIHNEKNTYLYIKKNLNWPTLNYANNLSFTKSQAIWIKQDRTFHFSWIKNLCTKQQTYSQQSLIAYVKYVQEGMKYSRFTII